MEGREVTRQDQGLTGIAAAGRTISTHALGRRCTAMVVHMTRGVKIMRGFTGAGGHIVSRGVCPVRQAAAHHGKIARSKGENCKGGDDKLAYAGSHVARISNTAGFGKSPECHTRRCSRMHDRPSGRASASGPPRLRRRRGGKSCRHTAKQPATGQSRERPSWS